MVMLKFRFEMDFVSITDTAFQEAWGLEAKTQVIEYRASNSPLFSAEKMPGIAKNGNGTMKRGVFVKDSAFWNWY